MNKKFDSFRQVSPKDKFKDLEYNLKMINEISNGNLLLAIFFIVNGHRLTSRRDGLDYSYGPGYFGLIRDIFAKSQKYNDNKAKVDD